MVDALDSGSSGAFTPVWVRVPPPALGMIPKGLAESAGRKVSGFAFSPRVVFGTFGEWWA